MREAIDRAPPSWVEEGGDLGKVRAQLADHARINPTRRVICFVGASSASRAQWFAQHMVECVAVFRQWEQRAAIEASLRATPLPGQHRRAGANVGPWRRVLIGGDDGPRLA